MICLLHNKFYVTDGWNINFKICIHNGLVLFCLICFNKGTKWIHWVCQCLPATGPLSTQCCAGGVPNFIPTMGPVKLLTFILVVCTEGNFNYPIGIINYYKCSSIIFSFSVKITYIIWVSSTFVWWFCSETYITNIK